MSEFREILLEQIDATHDWFLRKTFSVSEEEGKWKPPLDSKTIYEHIRHMMCGFFRYYEYVAEKKPDKYVLNEMEYHNTVWNMIAITEDQRDMFKDLIQSMSIDELRRPREVRYRKDGPAKTMTVLDILVDFGLRVSDIAGRIWVIREMRGEALGIPLDKYPVNVPEDYTTQLRDTLQSQKNST
ncbi:MAG: DinB family protein [Candidatus Ranarchaeia archaeon]|jgi:hypothetical protein